MGTNFYLDGFTFEANDRKYIPHQNPLDLDDDDVDEPNVHLGKRSAAGEYCWDCMLTLCKDGESGIHTERSECYSISLDRSSLWYAWCPSCNQPRASALPGGGAAEIELGIVKARTEPRSGIQSCSSFSWAQPKKLVLEFLQDHKDDSVVVDEYGECMTGQEFLDMLEFNCPIHFQNLVGHTFL